MKLTCLRHKQKTSLRLQKELSLLEEILREKRFDENERANEFSIQKEYAKHNEIKKPEGNWMVNVYHF